MPDPLPLAPSSASPSPRSFAGGAGERAALLAQARACTSGRRLVEALGAPCLEGLSWPALAALARGEPVDPNRPSSWAHPDAHARAVLARHGVSDVRAEQLTMAAIGALIEGQARADREAGVDWSATPGGAPEPAALARAHARLPLDSRRPGRLRARSRPAARARRAARCRARRRRRSLALGARPTRTRSTPGDLRCWRIASPRWLALADEQLGPVGRVERPVGLLLRAGRPASRLAADPGAHRRRDPTARRTRRGDRRGPARRHAAGAGGRAAARAPERARPARRRPRRSRLAGPRSPRRSPRALGVEVSPGAGRATRATAGAGCSSRRHAHKTGDGRERAELALRVLTFAGRRFPRRRLGAAPLDPHATPRPSAVMELGEAVEDRDRARAAAAALAPRPPAQLGDRVRVGRMKGRPGLLTVTTADGASASTRRVVGRAGARRAARAARRRCGGHARRRRAPAGAR